MLNITLGKHSYHNDIIAPWGATLQVGNFCSIAHHLEIIRAQHVSAPSYYPNAVSSYPFEKLFGRNTSGYPSSHNECKIIIENDVWIGWRCLILKGVTIGNGVIVGANSVIRQNIPPYAIVLGNPAQIIKYRFTQLQIDALQQIQWWNWNDDVIKNRLNDFLDINTFIEKYNK